MGFLFVDSFDHYTALGGKYETVANSPTISAGNGRFTTAGLLVDTLNKYLQKTVPSAVTYYVGFAYKYPSSMTTRSGMCWFISGATTQVALGILSTSHYLRVYTNATDPESGQTTLWTSSVALTPDVWNYIEFMATIGDSGTYALKVNGVEWVNTTGDTKPSTATDIQLVGIGCFQGAGITSSRYYDDFYIHDTAFQGDCCIIYRSPTGAGNYAQFDPSAGNNWDCVEETPPSTSEYVSTTVLNEIDTYAMADISQSAGTVKAVVGNYYVQKTDAGSRQIGMTTRLSSTDLVSTGQAVPSSWGYLQFIQETKPGGGAWSVQDTKDAEMGMKLTL